MGNRGGKRVRITYLVLSVTDVTIRAVAVVVAEAAVEVDTIVHDQTIVPTRPTLIAAMIDSNVITTS